ncbi:MAG: transglycosylase domain-containing protein [bacterium]|nr:transglycosylase domain-containing protein [bacterium]
MQDFKTSPASRKAKLDKQKNPLTTKQKILTILTVIASTLFVIMIISIIGIIGLFAYFARDLPSPTKIKERNIEQATQILDRNGKLLYSVYGDKNRTLVPLDKIPKSVQNATIAVEDKDFYKHQGVNWDSYLRIIKELVVYRRLIGGSSLTQQLVKNVLLSPVRTPTRKLRELILAIQVEKRYSKNEILQMYLNEIPYGGTAYGIQAASRQYFNKDVGELTITQSAILAGLPQSPTYYSPYGDNPKAYVSRTKHVLKRMLDDKYINKEQFDKSVNELDTVEFTAQRININAPHFTLWVKKQLEEKYGEKMLDEGGLRVYTSLDLDIQNKAQDIVRTEVEKLAKAKVGNGAAMVINPKSGEIIAMVGSKDYFAPDYDGQFNVSTSRTRQPGSATKPFTFAVSLMKGYTPATMWLDVKTTFNGGAGQPPYEPVNYDGKFRGPVQTRYALGSSLNIPAVKSLASNGIKETMQKSYEMGLSNWEPTTQALSQVGLSLTLGGREVSMIDMMQSYGVFANQGIRQDLVPILKVTNSSGKIIDEHHSNQGVKVFSEEISYLISHILSDDSARLLGFGPRSLLYIPNKTVAVKTGTTDLKRDNWAFGYTPSFVVGAWVGNNDYKVMDPSIASGVTGATPIWNKITKLLLENKPDEPFVRPANIISIDVDAKTGSRPGPNTTSTRKEIFIKGTQPQVDDQSQIKLKVCKGTNQVEKDGCESEEKTYTLFSDPYTKLLNKPGVCFGDCPEGASYSGYTSYGGSGSTGAPDIQIKDIPDKANVPLIFNFSADINPKDGATITSTKLYLDDFTVIAQGNSSPFSTQVRFKEDQRGEHRLRLEVSDSKGNVASKEITVNVNL